MGTRSLTHFVEDGKTICTVYRQYDGYPTGHGNDLKRIIAERTMVNGYGADRSAVFNGMGDLAACTIAMLKDFEGDDALCGHVYVVKPDSSDMWEDFVYTISGGNSKAGQPVNFKVVIPEWVETYGLETPITHPERVLYDGPITEFDPETAENKA